jgi:hypothetical protein
MFNLQRPLGFQDFNSYLALIYLVGIFLCAQNLGGWEFVHNKKIIPLLIHFHDGTNGCSKYTKKGHDQNILVILILLHFQDGTNEMKQYQFFTNCKYVIILFVIMGTIFVLT